MCSRVSTGVFGRALASAILVTACTCSACWLAAAAAVAFCRLLAVLATCFAAPAAALAACPRAWLASSGAGIIERDRNAPNSSCKFQHLPHAASPPFLGQSFCPGIRRLHSAPGALLYARIVRARATGQHLLPGSFLVCGRSRAARSQVAAQKPLRSCLPTGRQHAPRCKRPLPLVALRLQKGHPHQRPPLPARVPCAGPSHASPPKPVAARRGSPFSVKQRLT